jgi:preprotein translocase subunit SecG
MVVLLLISAFLVIVVLLQRGRGGGLAGAFGSGGGSSSAFGTKTGDVFTIVTVVLFVLFMLISIGLSFQFKRGNKPFVKATVPTAPSDLVLVAPAPTSVQLTWKDNSKDETAFIVERQAGSGDWIPLTPEAAADATKFTDNTVVGGTKYSYRVLAVNAAGKSKTSNIVTGTTPTTAPATTATATKAEPERPATAPAGSLPAATATAPRP